MTRSDDARRGNEALRERLSALTAAILCISTTVDLDTLLAEVVESAAGSPALATGSSPPSTRRVRPCTSSSPASPSRTSGSLQAGRQRPAVLAPQRPAGAATARRPFWLQPFSRQLVGADVPNDRPGRPDAPSSHGRRQLCPWRECGGQGVHRRPRWVADAVRLLGVDSLLIPSKTGSPSPNWVVGKSAGNQLHCVNTRVARAPITSLATCRFGCHRAALSLPAAADQREKLGHPAGGMNRGPAVRIFRRPHLAVDRGRPVAAGGRLVVVRVRHDTLTQAFDNRESANYKM